MTNLPISANRRVAFTPAAYADATPPRIYHLKVPTIEDRAEFNARIAARRALPVTRRMLMAEARRAVKSLDLSGRDAFLALFDRAEGVGDGEDLSAEDAAALGQVEEVLEQLWPNYAQMVERRMRWRLLAPPIAVTMFVIGWQNGPDGGDRKGLDDAARSLIPPEELAEVGWRAVDLMSPTEAQAKN